MKVSESAKKGATARTRILDRLRTSDRSKELPDVAELEQRINVHFKACRMDIPVSPAARARMMQDALLAQRARAWCLGMHDWPATLAQHIAEAGVRRIVLDSASAEGKALSEALPDGIGKVAFTQPLQAWKAELFNTVDAGFTVARSGIAATGTLILEPDAGTPRTVSLIPSLHIALVYASSLHADLHQALHAERWQDGMPTNLVLATGPSKTSDIQQTLAYGAHGPRWMWVVIVTDAEDAKGGS